MLDSHIRPLINQPLELIGKLLCSLNIKANTITGLGFLFAISAFISLAAEEYILALIYIFLNRISDGVDGAVARASNSQTDLGGFYDIVTDFIFYSGTIFFFAVGVPEISLAAAFLIFSFMGAASSFLAYAIIAAKHKTNHEKQGKKSFYYLSGITEGAETFLLLILICLVPQHFEIIAYIFGGLCWMTTLGRILQARKDFG